MRCTDLRTFRMGAHPERLGCQEGYLTPDRNNMSHANSNYLSAAETNLNYLTNTLTHVLLALTHDRSHFSEGRCR